MNTSGLPTSLPVTVTHTLTLQSVESVMGGVRVVYAAVVMGEHHELRVLCSENDVPEVPARIERMLRTLMSRAARAPVETTACANANQQDVRTSARTDDEPINWMGW